jgi:hypothetical protein
MRPTFHIITNPASPRLSSITPPLHSKTLNPRNPSISQFKLKLKLHSLAQLQLSISLLCYAVLDFTCFKMLYLAVLLLLLNPTTSFSSSGPHITDVNLLLPPKMTHPVEYRLQGSDGCFKWYVFFLQPYTSVWLPRKL